MENLILSEITHAFLIVRVVSGGEKQKIKLARKQEISLAPD